MHRRTVTQLPWLLDNRLVKKIEEWGKKGAAAIKRGCIEFLNRAGERFDWDNDDLSDLEVVSEQPQLVDPGVAAAPLPPEPEEELGAHQWRQKSLRITRGLR